MVTMKNPIGEKKWWAVVLNWNCECGASPVLVGVTAGSENEALLIAFEKAESGELFQFLYGVDWEDSEEMDIDRDSSFACLVEISIRSIKVLDNVNRL